MASSRASSCVVFVAFGAIAASAWSAPEIITVPSIPITPALPTFTGLTVDPVVPALPVAPLAVPVPTLPALPVVNPYDCQVEMDTWETAWTPDWKAWCCVHEKLGCPTTATSTATSSTSTVTTVTATTTWTSTETSTQTSTSTLTGTSTETLTDTRTSTVTLTRTSTVTTTVVLETTHPMPAVPAVPEVLEVLAGPKVPAVPAVPAVPEVTAAVSTPAVEATTTPATPQATSAAAVSTAAPPTTPAAPEPVITPAPLPSTSEQDDLGCESDCVILGESATCQSRITWVETHQTNKEIAPCPAAHVMVMSQCASCGTCQFQNVKCHFKEGISKTLGADTFMYKFQEPLGMRRPDAAKQTRSIMMGMALAFGMVVIFLVMSMALRQRRWRRVGNIAVEHAEE